MKNYKELKVGETFLIVEMSTEKCKNLKEFRIVLDEAYERSTSYTSYYIMAFHFEDHPNISIYTSIEKNAPGFEQPLLLQPNNRYMLGDEDKEIVDARCGTYQKPVGYMLGCVDDVPEIVSRCKAFLMESLEKWQEKINRDQANLNKRTGVYKRQLSWLCSVHDIDAIPNPPEKE